MAISREKETRMWALADELAQSGRFNHWRQIEWELRERGYSRAPQLLNDVHMRDRLDRMCTDARTGHLG